MKNNLEEIKEWILGRGEKAVEYQKRLTALNAVGPENGGQGEWKKAEYIESLFKGELKDSGFQLTRLDAPDKRVESGARPNLIAFRRGGGGRTLWIFAHLDVVPAGDARLWKSDPWQVRREGDLLFGRGVEDNQQAVCSMLLLAGAPRFSDAQAENSLGLVFMADEENGSEYGLKWILNKAGGLFKPRDMYIVPDGGSPDGSVIEIAEKAQLWLRFTVLGRQCHASSPDQGVNSLAGAARLIVGLGKLAEYFPEKNSLFIPPVSTFTPTRHEENTGAINILPGRDVFYMDCRVLPEVNLQKVMEACSDICGRIAAELNLKIKMDVVHKQPATALPEDAPIIGKLERAIYNVYGVKARPAGIGGATVAAMLREREFPAVVWSCLLNTCHQPDERSSILACLRDAAVFAELLTGGQPHAG